MNKALSQFFTDRGMTVTGNTAYGVWNGYEVNAALRMMDTAAPLRLHFTCFTTPDQRGAIEVGARHALPGILFSFTPYGVVIGMNALTLKKIIKKLPALFDTVLNILKTNGALGEGYCPVCGAPLSQESKQFLVDGNRVTLDCACTAQINAAIQAGNREFDAAPNHYLQGFGGAVIGGIVGALVAFLLFQIGFISAISVFVAIALGSFLYVKFGGKPNKGMIAIVSVTSLVFMVAAVFGVYFLEIRAELIIEGLSMSVIEAFGILMDDPEFSSAFIWDLVMTVIFSIIGVACEIVALMRKIKRQTEIR